MNDIYALYKTDEQLEKGGVWVEYPGGERFLIARISTPSSAYSKMLQTKLRAYRRQIDNNTLDETKASGILVDVFARTAILDWQNVKTKDGYELPFSTENAVTLMQDLPDFYKELHDQAQDRATFQDKQREEEAKN